MDEHDLDEEERYRVLSLNDHEEALRVMRELPRKDRVMILYELGQAALTPSQTEMVKRFAKALE